MVRTDFKLRYQGSVLGYVWSLLRPLLLSGTLYIIFAKVFGLSKGIPHYGAYLLLGIMCWTFFVEVTTGGIGSIVAKGDLIRKISIPRYLPVLSSSVSAFINFCLNFIVLSVIMAVTGVDIQWKFVILIPFLVLELYIFALSLAFLLSAAYVKFRDITFIWEVLMQMLFYLTPILVPIALLTRYSFGKYLLVSPIAQVIQDMRNILITTHEPGTWAVLGKLGLVSFLIIALTLWTSIWYFRKEAKYFAENV